MNDGCEDLHTQIKPGDRVILHEDYPAENRIPGTVVQIVYIPKTEQLLLVVELDRYGPYHANLQLFAPHAVEVIS